MLEYFLFSFAYSPIITGHQLKMEKGQQPTSLFSNALPPSFTSALKFTNNSVSFKHNGQGVVLYYEVLKDYLEFFLPKTSPLDNKENILANHVSIFSNKREEPHKLVSVAEFAIGTLLEVWLCQNDYQARAGHGELSAFWVSIFY
jgi:hypothetical protein